MLFKVGDDGYSADVVVGTNTNGITVLYDLVNIVPRKITEATDTIQGDSQVSRREASVIVKDNITSSTESQANFEKNNLSDDAKFSMKEIPSEMINYYNRPLSCVFNH